ncbi:MAG: tetratricopeptide repeat protein, partial [Planctomycetes bacterium]|nr:tetratricopeptide repeat protein [Planctomycetota bacterium]
TLESARAVPLFSKSYEIRRAELGEDDELTQLSGGFLGHAHVYDKNDTAAEPLLRRAIAKLGAVRGPTSPEVLELSWSLANVLGRKAPSEAEALIRTVLEQCEADPDVPAASRVRAQRELGVYLRENDRAMESILPLRKAVEMGRKLLPPDDRDTIQAINSYANALVQIRRSEDAEPLMRDVVESARKAYGDDHPAVIRFVGTLAWTIAMQFRPDREAEQMIRYFIDIALERRGVTDWTVHAPITGLCWLQMRNEQYDLVVQYASLLLEGHRLVGEPGDWQPEASAQQLIGTGLSWQGRAAEAIEPLDAALTLYRQGSPTNPTLGLLEIELGRACLMAGEYERAAGLLDVGIRDSKFRLAPFKTEAARYLHAAALTALGRDQEAGSELDATPRFLPQDPIELRLTGGNLIELFGKLGEEARAREWRDRLEAMPKETP